MMTWKNILKSPLRYEADEERDALMNFPSVQKIRAFEKENIEPKFESIVAKQPFGSPVSLFIGFGDRDTLSRYDNIHFSITPSIVAKLAGYSLRNFTDRVLRMLYEHIQDELFKIYTEEGFMVKKTDNGRIIGLSIKKKNEMGSER